jgi:DNA-binding Lrp family transcriptional regulator
VGWRCGHGRTALGRHVIVTAIVLINAALDRIQAIAATEGVTAVYSVAGRYDLVAILRLPSLEAVEAAIPGALDQVPGVTASETLVAFRAYSDPELDAAFDLGLD